MDAPYFPHPLPVAPSLLGESPFWHPHEQALYWCDIASHQLHRYQPEQAQHEVWTFDTEPGCCAPMLGGRVLLGMRDGLWCFTPQTGQRRRLVAAAWDAHCQRANDGKADPQGRFWCSTVHEPRQPALAALYRWAGGRLLRMAGDATVGNGLAWSPDGRTLYWSDTTSHTIYAFDVDLLDGSLSGQRVLAQFPLKTPDTDLKHYGGRPDGAAVDVEGAYWVAMYEGQRLLRLAPDGRLMRDIPLPVRCPTMPCFGGPDLRTLYLTTARDKRPHAELMAQPWAGCVLSMRVEVPGLPVNFAVG